MDIKIASLQYRYDLPADFDAYQKKISRLVSYEASQEVQLLVFPEYAGWEMSSFAPLEKMQEYHTRYLELFQELSCKYRMLICSGTHIVNTGKGTFNRSYLFSPHQKVAYQDKCILTPYEVEEGILSPGHSLKVFETDFGEMGICVCYDIEFPTIVQQLTRAGVKLILVPSYTASVHGFYRVFLSCRARALEHQCYVVQSALVGPTDIEMVFGASAVCGPVDEPFPEDGVIALGKRDQVESVYATLKLQRLEQVRAQGETHNHQDGQLLSHRRLTLESVDLR